MNPAGQPSTMARARTGDLAGDGNAFTRILVLVEGGEAAARAVARAVELAARDGADLALLAVVDRRPTYNTDLGILPATLLGSLRREARGLLVNASLTLPPGLHAAELLREGEPPCEVVAAARAWRADLIVVGREEHGLFGRLLPGTADQIARQASCPVLVVGSGAPTSQRRWWGVVSAEEERGQTHEALA